MLIYAIGNVEVPEFTRNVVRYISRTSGGWKNAFAWAAVCPWNLGRRVLVHPDTGTAPAKCNYAQVVISHVLNLVCFTSERQYVRVYEKTLRER